MSKKLPIIGITQGDPSGVGPEITVKALIKPEIYEMCRPIVVGDVPVMERALSFCGLTGKMKIHKLTAEDEDHLDALTFTPDTIHVLDQGHQDLEKIPPGTLSGECGNAAFDCIVKVIELAMAGKVDATVTNPLNKEALNMGGHHFAGHTEIYAHYTNTDKYTMMLAHENLRVVHVSTHVSLREACDRAKKERVLEVITIAHNACRQLGIEEPRIAVAGLNPHCGEGGLFGTEEIDEIIPAVEEANRLGMKALGPLAPDTVFSKIRGGMYDIGVAMYHDQGHIALKMDGFVFDKELGNWKDVAGVNITLGLPIIRASVDHGTAFGHAGKGNASELSLVNAIGYAVQMTP